MSRPIIIVMVKAPVPGTVKTRLRLPPEDAAALAAAFAADAVRNARAVAEVLMAYAPDTGRALLEPLLPPDLHWTAQRGGGLGERLAAALADAAALGFGPLLVIGTDSPTLPLNYLTQALTLLTRSDVVLGPTEDGGFYLLGTHRPQPELFVDVAWSSAEVLAQTTENARAHGYSVGFLPPWYDIDTPEDLERLRRELDNDPQARRLAPATARIGPLPLVPRSLPC